MSSMCSDGAAAAVTSWYIYTFSRAVTFATCHHQPISGQTQKAVAAESAVGVDRSLIAL